MSEQRTEKKPERAPAPPQPKEPRQTNPDREPEPLDEQSLDEVLRDCPL